MGAAALRPLFPMSDPISPVSSTYEVIRPVEVFLVEEQPRRRYWLHALLLLLTLFTTLVVGARLQYNFLHNLPAFSLDDSTLPMFPLGWIWEQPARLLLGVPFSATLMLILLAHEMGHFLYCVRYGVHATLPFFIPAPTLIGTLGAFIRIKSPIRSRAALFDIGIAGPIAGFVVALITLLFALTLSKPMPRGVAPSDLQFGFPPIFHLMHWLMVSVFPALSGPGKIPLDAAYMHPTAVAAWVGMFATALNLLPGGQLDGGHIVFALAPRAHKHISRITIGMLLPMGFFLWAGWLVWALLLTLTGVRHPQVPSWPGLNPGRKLLALFGLIMLLLTFAPMPFHGAALR
jgi:membrane-associated protease RseP (regulator of RpoE activity)